MTPTQTAAGNARATEPRIDDTQARYSVEVVPALPSTYPRQHRLTCGEANVRALLDAFEIEFTSNPEPSVRERLFGLSFPGDIAATLIRHGLDAGVGSAQDLHNDSRLALLRGHVDSHEPVILAIGNRHLSRGRDSTITRAFRWHFVTVYGYDAGAGVFFVYDPALSDDHPTTLSDDHPTTLPAGNDVRSECQIVRDWAGAIHHPWIGLDHTYIPVGV